MIYVLFITADGLRYDLSSVKDSYSPSSSSSSSYTSRYPSSYSAQTNLASSSANYSPSSSSGSYPSSSDYALASNDYRQYLSHQMSNPSLFNRVSQYMPYISPSTSSFSNSNNGAISSTNSFPSTGSSSSLLNDPNRTQDSLYTKPSDLYYKSPSSGTASLSSSSSSSESSNSGSSIEHLTKGSKVSNSKEEIGFFRRNDNSNHKRIDN